MGLFGIADGVYIILYIHIGRIIEFVTCNSNFK